MLELIRSDHNYDFIGKWKICVAGSVAIILIGVAAIPIRGVRWGIDFAGGTEMQVHFADGGTVEEGKLRNAVESVGIVEPSVVRYGEAGSSPAFLIRFKGSADEAQGAQQNTIIDDIQKAIQAQVGEVHVDRVEFVGPKVGAELRTGGAKAMAIALLLILVYVAMRFSLEYAPGGVIAVIHDVLITSSVWLLWGQQFDLQVLAALLAIVGYSINDTIVIFDRIRELMGLHTAQDLPSVINQAVNQTLSRTILTSGATLLSVIALLALGGKVIFPFAATMAIGIVVGTFSSVYIASPIMLVLTNRKSSGASKTPAKAKKNGKQAKARA